MENKLKYKSGDKFYRIKNDKTIITYEVEVVYKVKGTAANKIYFTEEELDKYLKDNECFSDFSKIKELKIKMLEEELGIKLKEEN